MITITCTAIMDLHKKQPAEPIMLNPTLLIRVLRATPVEQACTSDKNSSPLVLL